MMTMTRATLARRCGSILIAWLTWMLIPPDLERVINEGAPSEPVAGVSDRLPGA
jgi:hypothetical protein